MTNAYIRFLEIVDSLDRMNPARSLGYVELQLLEYIMQHHVQNKAIWVGDLISLNHLGSQATLHGRLKSLVLGGYVKLLTDKEDARKKSVIPTRLAAKYIEFMSNCLEKSVKVN